MSSVMQNTPEEQTTAQGRDEPEKKWGCWINGIGRTSSVYTEKLRDWAAKITSEHPGLARVTLKLEHLLDINVGEIGPPSLDQKRGVVKRFCRWNPNVGESNKDLLATVLMEEEPEAVKLRDFLENYHSTPELGDSAYNHSMRDDGEIRRPIALKMNNFANFEEYLRLVRVFHPDAKKLITDFQQAAEFYDPATPPSPAMMQFVFNIHLHWETHEKHLTSSWAPMSLSLAPTPMTSPAPSLETSPAPTTSLAPAPQTPAPVPVTPAPAPDTPQAPAPVSKASQAPVQKTPQRTAPKTPAPASDTSSAPVQKLSQDPSQQTSQDPTTSGPEDWQPKNTFGTERHQPPKIEKKEKSEPPKNAPAQKVSPDSLAMEPAVALTPANVPDCSSASAPAGFATDSGQVNYSKPACKRAAGQLEEKEKTAAEQPVKKLKSERQQPSRIEKKEKKEAPKTASTQKVFLASLASVPSPASSTSGSPATQAQEFKGPKSSGLSSTAPVQFSPSVPRPTSLAAAQNLAVAPNLTPYATPFPSATLASAPILTPYSSSAPSATSASSPELSPISSPSLASSSPPMLTPNVFPVGSAIPLRVSTPAQEDEPPRKRRNRNSQPRYVEEEEDDEDMQYNEDVEEENMEVDEEDYTECAAGIHCLWSDWKKEKKASNIQWVCCGECAKWYHSFCVNLDNKEYKDLEVFICCGVNQTEDARMCVGGDIHQIYDSISGTRPHPSRRLSGSLLEMLKKIVPLTLNPATSNAAPSTSSPSSS